MRFEWDPAKAASNYRKHRVTFDDAIPVFADPGYIVRADDGDTHGEERWIAVGRPRLSGMVVLLVVYVDRGDVRRIVSARRATVGESDDYYSR